MIEQYKKIAIINTKGTIEIRANEKNVRHKVNLNLAFTPRTIIFTFRGSWSMNDYYCILSDFHNNSSNASFCDSVSVWIENINKESFNLVVTSMESRSLAFNLERIIAIE